ncbi:Squalene Monooxygenase [Manis pentadactyla]|nr:Squalene Monooxygenase [Manis pentadactyla]
MSLKKVTCFFFQEELEHLLLNLFQVRTQKASGCLRVPVPLRENKCFYEGLMGRQAIKTKSKVSRLD